MKDKKKNGKKELKFLFNMILEFCDELDDYDLDSVKFAKYCIDVWFKDNHYELVYPEFLKYENK